MKKKSPSVTICVLFILISCDTIGILAEKSYTHGSEGGITFYVGGTGPGNYSSIQYAINASSDGDTVFVYDESSPYNENIEINRSINLIGEDKNTTIINGISGGNVINVNRDWVNISGFTIGDGGNGIYIGSDNNVIWVNIIKWNKNDGIFLSDYSDNNIIMENIISYNNNGIYLSKNKNNNITGNIIFNNYNNGIQEDPDSFNNNINGNIIKSNWRDGMYLKSKTGSTVKDNNISENGVYWGDGIFIRGNYYNIAGNTILNNKDNGIYLYVNTVYNIIKNNSISNNPITIEDNKNTKNTISDNIILDTINIMYYSSGNNIFNNIFFNSSIFLYESNNNNISNNLFFNGGFSFSYKSYQNIIYNNSVNGKPIVLLEDKYNIIIDSVIVGQIIIINCYNITIRNQEILNTNGIIISDTHNSLISDNTISNNSGGIYLSSSSNNTIKNNTIKNNIDGIYLFSYNNYNNIITDNIITDNNYLGIRIWGENNTISGNIITNNKIDGISISGENNTISSNIITNNNDDGISLYGDRNTIIENNISKNENGVYLSYCNGNKLTGNSISNNIQGIYIVSSTNTKVLKNNFLNNKRHALFENCKNIWNQNYWGRPMILPKFIFGTIEKNSKEILWFNIDWRPAFKPYNIPIFS